MPKPDVTEESRSVFPLIEESVVLLRRAPACAWVCHLIGTGPFVLGFVRFWAVFSGGDARANPFGWAFLLAALHVWMRVWQSRFGAMLFDVRNAQEISAWTFPAWRRAAVNQLLYGMPCFVGLAPALLIMIPFGWMFAFYQNVAINAHRADGAKRSWAAARYAPYQNHILLGWLLICWMVLFLNVVYTLAILPYGVKWLFPVEWVFMKNPYWFFSTTFICAAVAVTYLLFDPLVKALYVLRVFYGLSRTTGEDLRTDWRKLRASSVAVAAVLLFACAAHAAPFTTAEAVPVVAVGPGGAASAEALEGALVEAAENPRYAWRKIEYTPQEGSWFDKYIAKPVKKFFERIERLMKRFRDWLDRKFSRERPGRSSSKSDFSFSAQTWYIVAGGVLVAVVALVLMWYRRRRTGVGVGEAVALPQVVAAPDVSDESVTAEVLPEDEWLRLAEQFCASQDYRKAARAFFLACLACLAKREWITLRRSKTNADYVREMRRRALGRVFDEQPFCSAVNLFESGWYGEHPVTVETLGALRVSVEAYRHGR